MQPRSFAVLWFAVILAALPAHAQYEAPADTLSASANRILTWPTDESDVMIMEGPVTIEVGHNRMTADNAVMWVSPVPRALLDERRVEVSLLGNAVLTQPNNITRSGPRLYVEAFVRGKIFLTGQRVGGERTDSDLYKQGLAIRPVLLKGGQPSGLWNVEEEPMMPATQPATRPAFRPLKPTSISARQFVTTNATDNGNVAAVLTGGVTLIQRTEEGEFLELQAQRAVLFTPFKSLLAIEGVDEVRKIEQAVLGAYLEGDVRIDRTPAGGKLAEQSLTADRAYYDFTTDRAVLTDVVMHTRDLKTNIPMVVRADKVRQLSLSETTAEYTAEKARLSTSSFHTPSYSVGAGSMYIRTEDTGNPLTGVRTHFTARNATFDIGGIPVFYTPWLGGSVAERNALRGIETTSSSGFGFGVSTEWGLFETIGRMPPPGLDVSYNIDYFSDRGLALGLSGEYGGSYIDRTTLDPWSFEGQWMSYFVPDDNGEDELGRRRSDVEPEDETRGRFYWEHQHFLPGDWQVQLSGGYISDPTFMEEWFNSDFRTSRPLDTSIYGKRQRDTEAFTFLASIQPNDFVTVSDLYQEQAEVERLEMSYRRIGDSWSEDRLTFFSTNTVSAMEFDESDYELFASPTDPDSQDLGFRRNAGVIPGLPSYAYTGTPGDTTYRGDFRQEINWPFSFSRFRVVPYVIGRYTGYSESVDGSTQQRLAAAAGIRSTTAFWKVNDSAESELFDIHRLRHVIEPELNLYGSVQDTERKDLLIYDESIDGVTDISAISYGINQRWQTKRGGPGNWRSVDFLTLNVVLNYFFNEPPEREVEPNEFRGLYFVSQPETSIPRHSINADARWRVSDAVTILADEQFNLEESELATASIGLQVRQDPRLSYYVALRHIGLNIDEDITVNDDTTRFLFEDQDLFIFAFDYQLTPKYRFQFSNSYDFAQSRPVRSTVSLIRQFDRFFASISVRTDRIEDDNAIFFNVWPEGLQPGTGSQAVRGTGR